MIFMMSYDLLNKISLNLDHHHNQRSFSWRLGPLRLGVK